MSGAPPPLRWPPDLLGDRPPTRLGGVLWALAVVLVATWDLAGRSILHRDLPRFAVIAREMLGSGDWLVPSQHGRPYVNKPILYIWAVAGPSALAGDASALWLRLPNALALVFTAVVTSVWGRARTGSLAVGRLAGLLAVTTMLLHELGRTGRPDMFAAAFSTGAAAFLDRAALGRGRRLDPLWAGLCLGAGVLSKGPAALLVPAAVLLAPTPGTTLRGRARGARVGLVAAVGLAVPLLWLLPAWARGGDAFFRGLVVDQVKDRVEGRTAHKEGPFYYLTDLPLVLAPWSPLLVGAAVATAWPRVRARLGATLPAAVAAVVVVLSLVPTKEVRYAAVVVPPLGIVGAQAAAALGAACRDARRVAWHLRAGGVAAVVLGLASVAAMVRWPATVPGLLPLAVAVAGSGVLAVARARRADEPAPTLAGRGAGLAVVVAAAGILAFWVVLARYLVTRGVEENRQVARVLPAGVPVAVWMGNRLEPDDLFEAVARPLPVREPADLPTVAAAPRLVVVAVDPAPGVVEAARGQAGRELLRWPHPSGGTLVVTLLEGEVRPDRPR